MKYLELCYSDRSISWLKVPLTCLGSLSFGKSANVIEGSNKQARVRGYACRSINFSFSVSNASFPYFPTDKSFIEYTSELMDLKPDISIRPFYIKLGDNVICPELLFSPTSISKSVQCDRNGTLQSVELSIVLSGVQTSVKWNPADESNDARVMPKTIFHVNGYELELTKDIRVSRYEMTPTSLYIELLLGYSNQIKKFDEWLQPCDRKSYFEVEGRGKFYLISSDIDDNFASYECSVFPQEAEKIITKSFYDVDVKDIFDALSLDSSVKSNPIYVDHFLVNKSSIETIYYLREKLGLLVAFDNNKVHAFEVPNPVQVSHGKENLLQFYVSDIVKSTPIKTLIYEDSTHRYSYTDESMESGTEEVVKSNICLGTDRTKQIHKVKNTYLNSVEITCPYDSRVRHFSYVSVVSNDNVITGMVSDFSFDFVMNQMRLRIIIP